MTSAFSSSKVIVNFVIVVSDVVTDVINSSTFLLLLKIWFTLQVLTDTKSAF